LAPAPKGKIPAAGIVLQTAGADPKAMKFPQSAAQWGPETGTLGVHALNKNVFQVKTSLIVTGPAAPATLAQNGRSGPATFTWCPGILPLPQNGGTFACTNPAVQAPNATKASIRYQATSNQFGGVLQAKVGGGFSVVLRNVLGGGSVGPCDGIGQPATFPNCEGVFSPGVPAPTGVGGGPIGGANFSNPAVLPNNIRKINVAGGGFPASGNIISVGAPVGTAAINNVSSYGAPWTTGKVTVFAPLALGTAEQFWMQGGDNRVNGVGTISLVSGGVSHRSVSGDNANRGWLNYTVARIGSAPSISNSGLVLLAVIFAGTSIWMIRRATATVS
jgi:hypothetical protein